MLARRKPAPGVRLLQAAARRRKRESNSMSELPEPVILEHDGILVVRDDLLAGGTKGRALPVLFGDAEEYAYASPVYGYAQIALAHCAARLGKKAIVFCARRKQPHPRTMEAYRAGANVFQVDCGYMSVVKKRAKDYCRETGAKLLPFGLDDPRFIAALSEVVARALRGRDVREIWCAAGSGVLCRAIERAFPKASVNAVRVGAEPVVGRAKVWLAPERFEQDAQERPPFPSCSNYDAKVWRFIRRNATPGAVFWNVAR